MDEPPADFKCAICKRAVSNRWNYSAKTFEHPPICKSCETVTGYSWTGAARHRTKLSGGTHRDKHQALRIDALADAIAQEANRQIWSPHHARA